jgi:hypothetical protein
MNAFKIVGALLIAAFVGMLSLPTGAQPPAKEKPRDIDVVICLDISGSMDGLIESAKNKLWDIVNELAKVKPTPNLRVALYTYGEDTYDPKAGWVKKDLDLTTDLDLLYQKLFALKTNGGTEYATRVARDAVRDLKWSEDKGALKLIFVCGNEPAGQDPMVKLKDAADFAKAKGIIINPIYCGNPDDPDARDWREYAGLSGGRFATIDQNRNVAIVTPVDKKLAELGVKLNDTYVSYGKEGRMKAENQKVQTQNAVNQSASVAASRTLSQAGGLYRTADWDLVDKLKADPKFDITKIPEADLSDALKKLKPAERIAHVKEMTAKREALQKEIGELQVKRTKFIAEEMRKNPDPAGRAFDSAIRETLRIQAASKGIVIPKD